MTPDEPPRRGIVKRLVLGCLAVVALSATGSALFISGEINALTKALSQNPSLSVPPGELASAGFGGPQTLLLVGDDQRALTKYYHRAVLPHANEMLLVRLDPNKPWISMMSVPRELQVTITPPHSFPVRTRLNYAYTAGGIPLLLSTIKQALGVSVNHVVVITFARFRRAVDQMGCVYSTIDRRYYHSNIGSIDQYQEINLQPGYQKICGNQALQFVSYRHNDTSLVRDARDQSFLLDVKKQYGPTLSGDVHKFEQIFGGAVQTDPALHTSTGILDLLGTLVSSSGRRVRQVPFQVNLLPTYDTASPQQISASVHSFLFGGSPLPKNHVAAVARAVHRHKLDPSLPLVPTGSTTTAQARTAAAGVPFPYEFPRVQDRAGGATPVFIRDYMIHAPDHAAYPAYVAVFAAGGLGQYYDVQGMTWTSAPQFDNPDQTIHVGSRTLLLYYEAEKLRLVAWREHGAVYWIRNTLTHGLGNGELLAIAEQTTPIVAAATGSGGRPVRLGAVRVPGRAASAQATSTWQTVGSIGGLLTLVGVPLVAIGLLRRRRELVELRITLRSSLRREAQLASAPPFATPRSAEPRAASRGPRERLPM